MNRLVTSLRLLRRDRRDQLRALLERGLLPWSTWRRNRLVFVRCRAVKPLSRPLDHIRVRWGGPEDLRLLQALRPRHDDPRHEGYGDQFRAGRLLVVGESGGEPVSCNWLDVSGCHASPANAYRFHFGPGSAWAFGMEVAPRFRLSGAFPKHWAELFRLLGERGIHTVYGAIQADNPRSLGSHLRLGFEILGTYSMVRVLGLVRYRVLGPDGSCVASGRGGWQGHDPFETPLPALQPTSVIE